MMTHHTLSIVGLAWMLVSGKYGTEMIATICGSEVTNPLLQLRWFLRGVGGRSSQLGTAVDVTFAGSFFLVRIALGSVFLAFYLRQSTDVIGRAGAVSIYAISWIFWLRICRYAVRRLTGKAGGRRLLSDVAVTTASMTSLPSNGTNAGDKDLKGRLSERPDTGRHSNMDAEPGRVGFRHRQPPSDS